MKSAVGFFLGCTVVATTMVGCGGANTSAGELPDPEVRFVNLTPNATGVDFRLNDEIHATNLAFGTATSDFVSIEEILELDGGYDIEIRPNGASLELDREFTVFRKDTDTLVMAIGLHTIGTNPTQRGRIAKFEVDREAPTANKSRLIVYNAFLKSNDLDSPNVTFQSIIPGDPASIENPLFVQRDMGYGGLRELTIDSGTWTFIARRADTDALVQYASRTFNFLPGRIYLAAICGQEDNPNLALTPRINLIEISAQ